MEKSQQMLAQDQEYQDDSAIASPAERLGPEDLVKLLKVAARNVEREVRRDNLPPADFEHGDDVALAHYLQETHLQGVVFDEGKFWRYDRTHWAEIPDHELNRMVQTLSGMTYGMSRTKVSIGQSRIKSIVSILSANVTQQEFFAHAAQGVNAANCFIEFRDDGTLKKLPHSPEHRQRHTLAARWEPGPLIDPPKGSLLDTLLSGAFKGDPQSEAKKWFLQQLTFVAISGYGTHLVKPKLVVFLGRRAENGKNQILDMISGLLPPGAVSAIPPVEFGDDNKLACLVGTTLNISGEMAANAIAGDKFKNIVTGDMMTARPAYAPYVTKFKPQAQHICAGNGLPPFKGGFDAGVKRRLAILEFTRVIPEEERIVHIGKRIATEEPDALLAWALGAAEHILTKRIFDEPPSSKTQVEEWTQTDPVNAWAADRVLPDEAPDALGEAAVLAEVTAADVFRDIRCWHWAEAGRDLPLGQRACTERLKAVLNGKVRYANSNGKRRFVGLRLAEPTDAMKRCPYYLWPEGSVGAACSRYAN